MGTKYIQHYSYLYTSFWDLQGNPTTMVESSFAPLGVKTGVAVPGYRQKIKKGISATSPYTSDLYSTDFHYPGSLSASWNSIQDYPSPGVDIRTLTVGGRGYAFSPPPVFALNHSPINESSTDAEALGKLYQRIRAVRSEMNGLQFLGELRQSIHMIRHPVDAFIKGLRSYDAAVKIKASPRSIPRVSSYRRLQIQKDIISGLWLEYSYGWKPLLNDVKGIAETAGRIVTERQQSRTRASSTKNSTPVISSGQSNGYIGYNSRLSVITITRTISNVSVRWTCGLSSDVIAPTGSLARAAQLSGFTLENFVPTLWELIPYSFIAEYFSNIGDIIEASCMSTAGITWLSKTVRRKTSILKITRPGDAPQLNLPEFGYRISDSSHHMGIAQWSHTSLDRTIPDRLPIPNLTLSLPGKENRYVNMAALLLNGSKKTSRGLAT